MGKLIMMNIFENERVYDSYEIVEERPFNEIELSRINTSVPGIVFQGDWGLSCKIFIADSRTQYFCKGLDKRSAATEGKFFDVTKVKVAVWKSPDTGKLTPKIYVPLEAVLQ